MEDVKDKIIELINESIECEAIVIFGSYARNTQNAESDIDIAIKPQKSLNKKDIYFLSEKLADALKKDIDLIDLEQLENDGFKYEILINGITIYCKNSYEFDMYKLDAFREYLLNLNKKKPVILCGDLNVAHKEIDLKNPKTNRGNAGFTDEERQKMTELLDSGFTDSFRYLYPEKTDSYTWWSYFANSREKNIGWRIDYFIVSKSIKNTIQEAYIYDTILGSDHCPVGIDVEI